MAICLHCQSMSDLPLWFYCHNTEENVVTLWITYIIYYILEADTNIRV